MEGITVSSPLTDEACEYLYVVARKLSNDSDHVIMHARIDESVALKDVQSFEKQFPEFVGKVHVLRIPLKKVD